MPSIVSSVRPVGDRFSTTRPQTRSEAGHSVGSTGSADSPRERPEDDLAWGEESVSSS